jgi:hypothetical protein
MKASKHFRETLVNHLNLVWSRADVTDQNTGFGHIPSVELGMPANATQNLAFPSAGFPGYGPVERSLDPRAAQNIASTFFSDHLPNEFWVMLYGFSSSENNCSSVRVVTVKQTQQ